MKNAYSLLDFVPTKTDLFIYDIIEYPNSFCIRYVYKGDAHILLCDKEGEKISSTSTPYKWDEISNVDDFWVTGWGITNDIDQGLPITPSRWDKNKKRSIQCTTYSTVEYLKERGGLKSAPDVIKNMKDDDNPLIIVYHFN